MSSDIILYDIASKLEPQGWSPNTLRTRMALNCLKIPFTTVWLSYPDIAPTLASLGVQPNPPGANGKGPSYTLPVIKYGEQFIVGSLPIALHLASAFPPTATRPALFPFKSVPLYRAVERHYNASILEYLAEVARPESVNWLDERGAEYILRTRAEWYGEDWIPEPAAKPELWAKTNSGFDFVAVMLRDNADGPFLLGAEPSYGDFILVAALVWAKCADEERWQHLVTTPELRSLWYACQEWLV